MPEGKEEDGAIAVQWLCKSSNTCKAMRWSKDSGNVASLLPDSSKGGKATNSPKDSGNVVGW